MQNAHFSSSGGAQRPSESTVSRSNTSFKEGVKQKRIKMYHKMQDDHCEKADISSKSTFVALQSPSELSQTHPTWSPEGSKSLPKWLEDVFWKLIVWKPESLLRTFSDQQQLNTSDATIGIAHMPTRAPFAHQNSVRLQTCLQFPVCSSHATDSVMEQTKTEETPTPKSRKQACTYDMAQRIIAQPVQNTNLASNNSRPPKKSTSDHRPTRILRSYQKQTTRIDADHDTTNDLAINSAVLRPRQLDNKKILPSTNLHD